MIVSRYRRTGLHRVGLALYLGDVSGHSLVLGHQGTPAKTVFSPFRAASGLGPGRRTSVATARHAVISNLLLRNPPSTLTHSSRAFSRPPARAEQQTSRPSLPVAAVAHRVL